MPSLYHLVNYLANAFLTNLWATFIPPASWRVFSGIFYKSPTAPAAVPVNYIN
jgi:hypothetical protein